MNDVLMAAVVFSGLYMIFKLILDSITRAKLINKSLVDEKVKYLFQEYQQKKGHSDIKWGMVLLGIGVALIIRQVAPYTIGDEGMFGLMFIFAGLGFLIYYFISGQKLKGTQQDHNTSES